VATRFFVDETDLSLGKKLSSTRGGIVYPGHPGLPEVRRRTPDEIWLRVVGLKRLVVITRDKRIRRRAVERAAWISHEVRGFVLVGRVIRIFVNNLKAGGAYWATIEHFVEARPDGPWMVDLLWDRLRWVLPDFTLPDGTVISAGHLRWSIANAHRSSRANRS